MSLTVEHLLKGRPLRTATANYTVAAACHLMRQQAIGVLAIMDDTRLVGILSERDIAVRVIAGHRDPMLTLVREVMTYEPRTVPADSSIPAALGVMLSGGFRHLPVKRGDAVIGMLSLHDIPPACLCIGPEISHVPALG